VKTELDTLVIALYVKIDDEAAGIARLPGRPPKLSHAELVCLAVEPPRTFRTATPLRLGRLERKTVAAESQELLS
jgi:hypothetical protein